MVDNDFNPYTLPTISFVGGSTQKFSFNTFMLNGDPFALSGCNIIFLVSSFTDRNGQPLIEREMRVSSNNVMTATFSPEDTIMMSGKYIYQIVIKHQDLSVEIPNQGIMYIYRNLDQSHIF